MSEMICCSHRSACQLRYIYSFAFAGNSQKSQGSGSCAFSSVASLVLANNEQLLALLLLVDEGVLNKFNDAFSYDFKLFSFASQFYLLLPFRVY